MQEPLPRLRRSLLFVPGHRPDRFDKAVAAGADMVCLDLEDAVPPTAKVEARGRVLDYLGGNRPRCELVVRINSPRTRLGLEDLLALSAAPVHPDLVAIPKVESAAELGWVTEILGEGRPAPELLPLVESLEGLARVEEIAAMPGVAMLGLGTGDLAADMGVTMDWEPMLLARLQVVQAAKRARVPALDGAWLQVDDLEGLAAELIRSAALGYSAKPCLHPSQVDVVHNAFAPTPEQVQQARELIAAFEAAGAGVFLFKGRMVDLPIVEAAQRQLKAWELVRLR